MVIKKQNKQKVVSIMHMSHILSLPFPLPTRQKRWTHLLFLSMCFWTSGFFFLGVEEEMWEKGLVSKEQDKVLNRILRKDIFT